MCYLFFFFSSRRRHTRLQGDWSSDVCSSDLLIAAGALQYSRKKFLGALALGRGIRFFVIAFLGQVDRKSTRLNSSHLVISYAVFCLKKKKKAHHVNLYNTSTNVHTNESAFTP